MIILAIIAFCILWYLGAKEMKDNTETLSKLNDE